jgi:hypothetical protein
VVAGALLSSFLLPPSADCFLHLAPVGRGAVRSGAAPLRGDRQRTLHLANGLEGPHPVKVGVEAEVEGKVKGKGKVKSAMTVDPLAYLGSLMGIKHSNHTVAALVGDATKQHTDKSKSNSSGGSARSSASQSSRESTQLKDMQVPSAMSNSTAVTSPVSIPSQVSAKVAVPVLASTLKSPSIGGMSTKATLQPVRSAPPTSPASPSEGAGGPTKSPALVLRKGATSDDLVVVLQEVLQRLGSTERELKILRKRTEGAGAKRSKEARIERFVIDRKATTVGAAVAGGLGGMIIGWSVFINLWLLGAALGAATCSYMSRQEGQLASICQTVGIQVALIYKDVKDFYDQTVFMYRTGKLSYNYWKVWETYDSKYNLTKRYEDALKVVNMQARELDRQYKIRSNALNVGNKIGLVAKGVGVSFLGSVTSFATKATGWSGRQLEEWGGAGKSGAPRKQSGYAYAPSVRGKSKPKAKMAGKKKVDDSPWANFVHWATTTPQQRREEKEKKFRVKFLGKREFHYDDCSGPWWKW